ncbi:hypothetical protein PVK06_022629 [Gossypium arboreum]|uniref:RNase H type-1 domain-containing protein n=1 Tax=Gossypium arboreum TaxID=29729 RepID=A0ABR0P8W2_GOSAR|nr:hypothetical protein PVK06_022629 [Gossypium arboreum]
MMVNELVCGNDSSWDMNLVEGLLSPYMHSGHPNVLFCGLSSIGVDVYPLDRVQADAPLSPAVDFSWSKPLFGQIKCNVDAATVDNENATSWAAIVRGFSGYWLQWMDRSIAEVMAARKALSWLPSHGFDNVLVETDCLKVWYALIGLTNDLSEFI